MEQVEFLKTVVGILESLDICYMKHIRDTAGMLQVSGDEIDRVYISDWAERLSLESIWKIVLAKVDERQANSR